MCHSGDMAKTTIDTGALYAALDAARQERHLSWRSLAKEVGVSPSMLSRLGNGLKPDADGFATLVAWLNLPAAEFFESEESSSRGVEQEPDLMVQLVPLLRAQRDLTPEDVEYLQQIIQLTVERARSRD